MKVYVDGILAGPTLDFWVAAAVAIPGSGRLVMRPITGQPAFEHEWDPENYCDEETTDGEWKMYEWYRPSRPGRWFQHLIEQCELVETTGGKDTRWAARVQLVVNRPEFRLSEAMATGRNQPEALCKAIVKARFGLWVPAVLKGPRSVYHYPEANMVAEDARAEYADDWLRHQRFPQPPVAAAPAGSSLPAWCWDQVGPRN